MNQFSFMCFADFWSTMKLADMLPRTLVTVAFLTLTYGFHFIEAGADFGDLEKITLGLQTMIQQLSGQIDAQHTKIQNMEALIDQQNEKIEALTRNYETNERLKTNFLDDLVDNRNSTQKHDSKSNYNSLSRRKRDLELIVSRQKRLISPGKL